MENKMYALIIKNIRKERASRFGKLVSSAWRQASERNSIFRNRSHWLCFGTCASMEMKRGNYTKALQGLLWLRKRNTGSEPKTLLTQIAQCYDAVGNKQLAYIYMDSARMSTDTLAQHNLTQKMAELNVKFQTQEKELQISKLEQRETGTSSFPAQSLRMRRMPAGYRIDSYTDITLQKTNGRKRRSNYSSRKMS